MKLAFSTNAYLNYSFAETCDRLAKIGYAGVEIMADVPHAWPAYLLPSHKAAIREALASNKLARVSWRIRWHGRFWQETLLLKILF